MITKMAMSNLETKSSVIILAANPDDGLLLRDVFAQHPDFHAITENTDKIWRQSNESYPFDTLSIRGHGTRKIQNTIQNYFAQQLKAQTKPRFAEYTHANIMRPAYIHKMMPHAKIIHIIRDGRYVSAQNLKSPHERLMTPNWHQQRLAFILGKLKFWQKKHDENHLSWPEKRLECQNLDLAEIAALEWNKAIEICKYQSNYIPDTHFLELRYEDLQFNTGEKMDELFKFIGFDRPPFELWSYLKNNIPSKIINWREDMNETAQKHIVQSTLPLLTDLEYCEKAA